MPSIRIQLLVALVMMTALSAAGAQSVFEPMSIDHVIRTARDGEDVLIRGRITAWVESDEILVQDSAGTSIIVDIEDEHRRMGLGIGSTILVLGELDRTDGLEIEAERIWRAQGATQSDPALYARPIADAFHRMPAGSIVALRGRASSYRERDEIILTDATGSIVVDLDDDHHLRLGIVPGEELFILAKVDNAGVFDRLKEVDAMVIHRLGLGSYSAVPTVVPAVVQSPATRPLVPSPRTSPKPSLEERLSLLKKLFDQGLITESEYGQRKTQLLAEL